MSSKRFSAARAEAAALRPRLGSGLLRLHGSAKKSFTAYSGSIKFVHLTFPFTRSKKFVHLTFPLTRSKKFVHLTFPFTRSKKFVHLTFPFTWKLPESIRNALFRIPTVEIVVHRRTDSNIKTTFLFHGFIFLYEAQWKRGGLPLTRYRTNI